MSSSHTRLRNKGGGAGGGGGGGGGGGRRGGAADHNDQRIWNKEIYQRMNFLYQAAHLMSTQTQQPASRAMSRFYANTLKQVSSRMVIRLHPSVKSRICRWCNSLLVPGMSSTDRLVPSAPHTVHLRRACKTCGFEKRVDTKRRWLQQEGDDEDEEQERVDGATDDTNSHEDKDGGDGEQQQQQPVNDPSSMPSSATRASTQ